MKFKKTVGVAASLTMAMGLFGCSSSGSNNNNVFTVGINATMNGVFSPMYYESTYDNYAIDLIYQGMLAYDVDQNLNPVLAKDMPEISEDGLTYTFHLNEGIKFSDGTDFTASDVKYTFTVLSDPSYTGRFSNYATNIVGYQEYHSGDATEVSGIETPDDYTVVFHLQKPRIDALTMLGLMRICSDEQFDYEKGNTSEIEANTNSPIGTGPYVLNSFDKSTGGSFVKNKEFKAEKGKYSIEKVVIKHTETATEMDELKSGTVDYLPNINDAGKISEASTTDNLTYDSAPGDSIGYFFFNCAQGATADKAVRQALIYATDRQSFVDSFFTYDEKASDEVKKEKLAYVATSYANPLSKTVGAIVRGEETLEGLNTYDYSLEKAAQVLDDAGWVMNNDGFRYKNGQKLTVRIMIADGSRSMDTLIPIIIKDWATIGVDLQQTIIDFNSLLSSVGSDEELGNWETSVLALSFNGLDDTNMNGYYYTGEVDNYSRISDPALDAALDEGMYTSDPEVSSNAYKQALIIANDDAACIPLYASNSFNLYNKRVKNMKTSSFHTWAKAIGDATLES